MPTTPVIYVLDVGQGSCNVIDVGPIRRGATSKRKTAGSRGIIIDCGPVAHQTLNELLELRNIETIEALILTHADRDHFGGLKALIAAKSGKIKHVYYSFDRTNGEDMVDVLDEHYKKGRILNQPEPISVKDSAQQLYPPPLPVILEESEVAAKPKYPKSLLTLHALAPDGHDGLKQAKKNKSNAASAVCLIRVHGLNVMFPGDATIDSFRIISKKRDHTPLASEAVVIPHHGGLIHSDKDDLDWLYSQGLKVNYGIISAGTNNGENHPRIDVLDVLYEKSIRVICTEITPNCSQCSKAELPKWMHRKGSIGLPSFSNTSRDPKIPCFGTIEFCIHDDKIQFAPPTNASSKKKWLDQQRKGCPLL